MIKGIIVDDELSAIKSLKWEIENFCENVKISDSFTSPLEAISAINYLKPDCVFLDIEMPEMDGFQLLTKLVYRDFDLIITTAYDNYAIRAFKESAIDYLLKPIDTDDLIKSISKIRKNKENSQLGKELQKVLGTFSINNSASKIALPLTGKIVYFDLEEIIYCKADGNYTEIYLKGNKREILSKKIKNVEELINNNNFFRVHNSFLVNIQHIREYIKGDGNYLVLDDQTKIPVSRSKKEEILQILSL